MRVADQRAGATQVRLVQSPRECPGRDNRVEISLVRDPDSFSALAGEWNRLLSRSVTDVPFLRHEFLKTWWSTRGGGEWRGAGLTNPGAPGPRGGRLGFGP